MKMLKNTNFAATQNSKPFRGSLNVALLLLAMLSTVWSTTSLASDGGRLVELLRDNIVSADLDTTDVTITEAEGVVTLSGRVLDAEQKQILLDLVRRTHGVKDVIDELDTDYDS